MNDNPEAKNRGERRVEVVNLPIELCKILKLEGLVQSGGEAKHVIASGQVTVNDVVETRKRKQIVAGDRIRFSGTVVEVVAASVSGTGT